MEVLFTLALVFAQATFGSGSFAALETGVNAPVEDATNCAAYTLTVWDDLGYTAAEPPFERTADETQVEGACLPFDPGHGAREAAL